MPVCLGVGAYSSFEVIDFSDSALGYTNLDPAPIQALQTNATMTVKVGEKPLSTAAASDHANKLRRKREAQPVSKPQGPHLDAVEQMRNGNPIAHGAVRRAADQVYKYQQLADRVWRGVPYEEWDADVHKRNEVNIASSRSQVHRRSDSIARRFLALFQERATPAAKYNLVRSCMIDSGDDPKFSINDVGVELLNAIHALNPTPKDWTWLEAPLVVEIRDSTGKCEGFIYAQTLEHSQAVNTCSDQGTERDALQAALAMGVDGSDVSDMRVDLKLPSGTGVTNSLFVSTRSVSNSDTRIHPLCEAVQVNF